MIGKNRRRLPFGAGRAVTHPPTPPGAVETVPKGQSKAPNTSDAPGAHANVKVPVSPERVQQCLRAAQYWLHRLPIFADRQQQLADSWAIISGVLSAITSLAIWPVLTADSTTLEKVLISAAAVAAAVCALMPRVKNYSDMAGQARELSAHYGKLVGELTDLGRENPLVHQDAAMQVLTEFQAIEEKRSTLRGLLGTESITAVG
jgi:hypothetical protein